MIRAGARSMAPVNHCMRSHALARCDWSDLPTTMCAHCLGHDMHVPIGVPAPPPSAHIAAQRPPRVGDSRGLPTKDRRQYAALPRRRNFPALCANEMCRKPREDGTPNPRATDGRANICPTCEDRARDNLASIADMWPDVEAKLGAVESAGGDRVKSTPTPGLVLNEAVSAVMTEVEERLSWWARLVRDERGATYPLGEPSIPETARWIARTHLPWIATHEDAAVSASICDDAHTLERACRRAAYGAPVHRTSLPFRCADTSLLPSGEAVPDGGDVPPCGARMSVSWVEGEPMRDAVCERGHQVPPSAWMRGGWARRQVAVDPDAVDRMLRSITSTTVHTSESAT